MMSSKSGIALSLGVTLIASLSGANAWAQFGPPGPPQSAKAGAPSDLTGYWVSVVVEDWRYRMLPPRKIEPQPAGGIFGGGIGVPINAEARKIALAWNPAKDEAAGEQCKSYGAPNLMRVPGRLHISWQDDQTLKIETDAGMQKRLFHFTPAREPGGDWQGVSQANWEVLEGFEIPGLGRLAGVGYEKTGSLKVVTNKLRPGYLRKNGVPYSANAVLTEYYDVVTEPDGDVYLLITSTVEDPTYLVAPYQTTTHFKKQSDASGWNPSPCTSR